MQQILEMLKNGDSRIVAYFAEAEKLWGEILWEIDNLSEKELAKKLFHGQRSFEQACGGDLFLGKTVMAWSGFAHLYSCQDGFEKNGPRAYKLSKAFDQSMCSSEVKIAAKKAAAQYSVEDYG